MGSSTKKKKDKKKDFQKTKLRVGKAKAKADNFTDTSFKARSITINQQSLTIIAPSTTSQFSQQFSLVTSKSDSQRRAALAHLTTYISSQPVDEQLPVPIPILLPRVLPLLLDGSASVRSQLLKLFACLPHNAVRDRVESCLLYIRAGMTHLAEEIRMDALNAMTWLLGFASAAVVTSPGGWTKILHTFLSMMGWASNGRPAGRDAGWMGRGKVGLSNSQRGLAAQMKVLTHFLKGGLMEDETIEQHDQGSTWVTWDRARHLQPRKADAFAHLDLFGSIADADHENCSTREERIGIFEREFRHLIEVGMSAAKQQGGELGRIAAALHQVVQNRVVDQHDTEVSPS